ncbi:DUF1192 domain-containing protein [Alphaproteobacteria bacterium]|nr:DUF1192 domain-containing protein [Alphaproteobacteria bacterium]
MRNIAKPAFPEASKKCKLGENSREKGRGKGDEKQERVMDDELDRLQPAGLPADKQRWNIEDLQAYVAAMQAEITHVESMIAEKNKVQSAANALFGGGD